MNTSTPILDAYKAALAQFRGTPAAQLGGRIRWTGTPEQVQALWSESMNSPGPAPVIPADGGPVWCGLQHWVREDLYVDLYAHPNGGGFSIDAEPPRGTMNSAPSGRSPAPATDAVTLAELEREFTPAQILGMFAASPDDPKWPLLLAWLAYGKVARIDARVASGAAPTRPPDTHAVDASRISRVEIREHMAGLVLPPATNDVDAQARATIVHLLAEAREPYGPGEKATLVGAAAQLLAALK